MPTFRFSLAALVLTALLSACGGGTPAAGPGLPPPPGPGGDTGDAVPAPLQGEWHHGSVSPIEYYDPSTGKYAESSGTSDILKLSAAGQYERVGIIVVTSGTCTSKLLVRQSGTVKLSGNLITLQPKAALAKGYTCSPSNSYERHDAPPSTSTWRITQTGGESVLVLGDPKGEARDSRYNRPRGTGPVGEAGTVSGVVHVEAGSGDALGEVVVMACPAVAPCSEAGDKWRFTRPGSFAVSTPFTLQGVVDEPHHIFAWTDWNDNGKVDRGDLFGSYTEDGTTLGTVTPPRQGLDITVTKVE